MDPLRSSSRVIKLNQTGISRPDSVSENRIGKVQKIKSNPIKKKRLKWNDRFHLEADDVAQQIIAPQIPIQSNQARKKKTNVHTKALQKRRNKTSHSQIPTFDIVSGKRKWGKSNNYYKKKRKRAKWSAMNKNENTNVSVHTRRQRAKWKKKPTQIIKQTNPLVVVFTSS